MTIAIIAHDSKKELLLQFCTAYRGLLAKHHLIATGTTGRLLNQALDLSVECYLAGRLGGSQQISSCISCGEVDLVIFFRDALNPHQSEPNAQNILRLCDVHGIAIATNIATAEVLLRGLDQGDLDYREALHA